MSFGNQEFEELKDWKVNLEFDVVQSFNPPKHTPKYLGIVTIPFPGYSVRNVHYQIFGAMSAPSHFSGFVGLRTDFSNIESQERPLITEGQIDVTNNRRIVFDIDDPRQDYFVLVRYTPKANAGEILGPMIDCETQNGSGPGLEPKIKKGFVSSPRQRQLFSIFYTSKLIAEHKNATERHEEQSKMTSRYTDFFPAAEARKRCFIAKNSGDGELEESSSELTPTSEDDEDESQIDALYQALLEQDPRSQFSTDLHRQERSEF